MSAIRETNLARTRPSRGDSPGVQAPRERSQVFDNPTPVVQHDTTDLSILSKSFGNFFDGLSSAAQTLQRADHAEAMHKIAQENEDQKAKGLADALAGTPDPTLGDDRDYMTAFSRTKGAVAGQKSSADFLTALSQQPFGTDPEAFRDEWVKREFGTGSGNPTLDGSMLSTFKQSTDHAILQFRVNAAKEQRNAGLSALSEEVYGQSGTASVADLQDWLRRSTTLSLGDEVKGRAHVLSTLIDSARTPQQLQRVEALLHEKNYGPQGQSFADMFPASAAQVSEKATKEYLSSLSAGAFKAYDDIEKQMVTALQSGDEKQLTAVQLGLEKARSQHGGEAVYDRLNNKLQAALDKVVRQNVAINAYILKGTQGGYPVDPEEANKLQPILMARMLAANGAHEGNNPAEWQSPLASWKAAEATAQMVNAYHSIGNDLKTTMSMALQDVNNLQAQSNAFRFYAKLGAEGRDVSNFMSGDAYKAYTAVQSLMRTTAQGNLEAALKAYNANPDVAKEVDERAKNVDWPTLMNRPGDQKEKVVADVTSTLKSSLADALEVKRLGIFSAPGKIVFQQDVGQELLADYARTLLEFRARGIPGAEDAAKDVITKNLTANYLSVPGADGTVQVVRRRDYPAFKDGVNIGPGVHMNPALGERENTLDNFRADLDEAKARMPGLFGTPGMFYVQRGKGDVTANGGFLLMNGEERRPVFFAPGQQIALEEPDGWVSTKLKQLTGVGRAAGGKTITLSKNPEEAQRELEAILPRHFSAERMDTVHGPVWRVFYQFHLTQPEDLTTIGGKAMKRRLEANQRDSDMREMLNNPDARMYP